VTVELSDENGAFQVADDVELLELMLDDLAAAAPVFQPPGCRAHELPLVVAELRDGLHDFRRRDDSHLADLGACDAAPRMLSGIRANPDAQVVLDALSDALNGRIAAGRRALVEGLSILDLYDTALRICAAQSHRTPTIASVCNLEVSRIGNPFGFTHARRFLTRSALFFYMRYAYVAEHVNFALLDTVVELGSGTGKQAEVLKRLHPHLTIVLLDTAPSLYVAERFLTAAYPDETVPYRETRDPGCALVPGHVHFFGNFRVDDIAPIGNTLFWSAATLEEMDPAAVAHYGRAITPLAESLYLHGCFGDARRAALAASDAEADAPTPFGAYVAAFPEHELVDRRVAHTGLAELVDRNGTYDDTFWARRWV
jgi:putative sugar O-methyltransferase